MTETRTPRLIVLEMEPLFRNLCQGTDAAVSLSRSRDIEDPDHNGLVFVAEGIDSAARRVHRARGRSDPSPGWRAHLNRDSTRRPNWRQNPGVIVINPKRLAPLRRGFSFAFFTPQSGEFPLSEEQAHGPDGSRGISQS